jgi:hypothetical protein
MVTGHTLYPDISGTLHALWLDFRVRFCALLSSSSYSSIVFFLVWNLYLISFVAFCALILAFLLAFVIHSCLLTVELRFLVEDLKRRKGVEFFGGCGSEEGVQGATRW